jgi:gamma-glutamylcyclotransferase (GGCT)/AIG2-like uncharacterized protein YtfP
LQEVYYFTYGTLQYGYPNHTRHAHLLGRRIGIYRTLERFPLIVPSKAACSNPGCQFVHRMGALLAVPGEGHHVKGEVYRLASGSLSALDALENYRKDDEAASAYLRRAITLERLDGDGPDTVSATVYFMNGGDFFLQLYRDGQADMVSYYTREMATGHEKPCCRADPSHAGPHVVIPLDRETAM